MAKKKRPPASPPKGQQTMEDFFPRSPPKANRSSNNNNNNANDNGGISNKSTARDDDTNNKNSASSSTNKTTASTKKENQPNQPAAAARTDPPAAWPVGTVVKKKLHNDENIMDDDSDDDDKEERDPKFQTGRLVMVRPDDDDDQPVAYTVDFDVAEVDGGGNDEDGGDGGVRSEEVWTAEQVAWGVRLDGVLETRVAKEFLVNGSSTVSRVFAGRVVNVVRLAEISDEENKQQQHHYDDDDDDDSNRNNAAVDECLYHIRYDDGDSEDFDEEELRVGQAMYQEHFVDKKKPAKKRAKRQPPKSPFVQPEDDDDVVDDDGEQDGMRKRRRRRVISYNEDDDDDNDSVDLDEEEDSADEKATARRRRPSGPSGKGKKPAAKKQKAIDSEDDFEMEDVRPDDDDSLDVDMMIESTDDELDNKPKKVRATKARGKKKVATASGATKVQSTTDGKFDSEFQTKLERDRKTFKPNNNPQKWPKDGAYVDPVGVDPTHGIIEGIVSAQVRKVGGLLQLVRHSATNNSGDDDDNESKGELTFPIRLQTACSGTDAPSIALGLIKESLDKMCPSSKDDDDDDDDDDGNSTKKGHLFEYTHEMSCEIEPFKQAYIGRNFPGVPLFPDITKLTASEEVLDVYGRPQRIPKGNLFVAGTSCKDFSMLKTSYRLDIEDKGTSGETFLAASEFLDQKQPPVSVFENVDGAPWDKMQEYIRGRIFLGSRNDTKAIKDAKKKADADKELKFSVNQDGRYVAEAVPRQVGIRAGSIVQGVVRDGHVADDVEPLVSKDQKNRTLTLGELAKKHKINLEADTLVMEKKARYCTHLCRVDTKDYGLPQTRNRKYLFIWRSDDPEDDLGEYFQEILDYLKTPLLHSMDAFLLPDTHDRIRCFREALRSGPGIMVKRERAKELDFWDWGLSRVKDLTLHMVFREKSGIAERSRWLTGWDTRGRKQIAPGLWPELVDCWNMRRLDMVDCFSAAAVRDAISRDPLHHSFTWDLSQNVTRAPFRSATCGVSGCVTPGGELILPHKGRTVMGYEKLLFQGIPFSRLLLGPESEVQLSDLAGNAMSVSVVCATMLAAMCAPQLRRQRKSDRKALLANFALSQKYDDANGAVLAQRGDLYGVKREGNVKDFVEVFGDIAKKLAQDAFRSSVLCTCESSGTTTKDPKILECKGCGMCVCHECSGRYQVASHRLENIDVDGSNGRPDPHVFERDLRCAVPSILRLGHGWEGSLKNGEGLESYTFQLQQVDRKRGHWQLSYGAWEDHGSARQVAEIRVTIGRTGTLDTDVGVAAFIRCFAPAIRHIKPLRGIIKDSARLVFKCDDSAENAVPQWEVPDKKTTVDLKIVGSGEVASQRVLVGLNDDAAKSLKDHVVKQSFKPPIPSRNSLTHYHPKWKTWPGTIVVSGDPSERINGTYRKLSCTHSIVLSALWCRDASDGQPSMYLFLRPDVLRTKLDVPVFAPTPSYMDKAEVCELHDWIPENALAERTHATKATLLSWKSCPSNLKLEVPDPTMSMLPQSDTFHERICSVSQKDSFYTILCKMGGLSKEVNASLLEYSEAKGEEKIVKIDLYGRSGTRNAKRLSIIAAPSLLKCAAEGKLPLIMSKWYKLLPGSTAFGQCKVNVPPRPVEKWQTKTDREGTVERVYDAEESNEYYQRLFNRPEAFQVSVEKTEGTLETKMNPYVPAHRAAAQLGGEQTGNVDVEYCLSELSSMGEPPTKEFHVPNSDSYEETTIDGLVLPLYKRQAKALSRMLAIENGSVPFAEEERSEIVLPGIGWCLSAKASKSSPLRGGVLGDAIGSGKTVVTIALILAGVKKARRRRDVENGRSSATLIVVPPGLVRQWDDERRKFTKDMLKCIIIDSTDKLQRYSVEALCKADMVIVPAGLIEETQGKRRPYTEELSKKAKAGKIPPAPTSYSQREAPTIEGTWVRNMASGPEIYVGNRGNQRTRDAQAYYGHCYSVAIEKLRQQKFSPSERGVPIEYFTWERIVIDECHETLVTGKAHETKDADFKEKARRGAREFLGVAQTDIAKRPLVAEAGVWGLTGTPLLETEARVTELANLMGGTYLTGAAHHWRKEERESGRDLFLNQQEGTRSREYRRAVQESCHAYVREACQRNRGEQLLVMLTRKQLTVHMSQAEGEAFLKETSDVNSQSFAISPDQLAEKAGDVLTMTASSKARHSALVETVDAILDEEPHTKIVVFANTSYGGYQSARAALDGSVHRYCHVSDDSSVERQNEILSWFRHVDVTEAEKRRPRILLLSLEQAAGHNLQEACHNVILYDPYYSGSDAVADASVEEQAVGRVMRQGQKNDVTVTRIVLKGPNGERCLDDWIVERNLDEEVLRAATSNFD